MEDDEVDKLEEEGGDEKEWWDQDGEEGYTLLNVIVLTGIGIMKCKKEKWATQAKKECNRKYFERRGRGGCWKCLATEKQRRCR